MSPFGTKRPPSASLVINSATARALGIDVPATLLGRADEVIDWLDFAALHFGR